MIRACYIAATVLPLCHAVALSPQAPTYLTQVDIGAPNKNNGDKKKESNSIGGADLPGAGMPAVPGLMRREREIISRPVGNNNRPRQTSEEFEASLFADMDELRSSSERNDSFNIGGAIIPTDAPTGATSPNNADSLLRDTSVTLNGRNTGRSRGATLYE